jgi:hypothetical protein
MELKEDRALARRLRNSRLKSTASVEDIDYQTPRGLDRALLRSLGAESEWVKQHLNIFLIGATGVGKSWLAAALAHKACRDGYTVYYARAGQLFRELALAHADGSFSRLLRRLAQTGVLVIDDWAMAPLSDAERRDFLEICDDRYQTRSTILTSQAPVANWHAQIGDPTAADNPGSSGPQRPSHRIEGRVDAQKARRPGGSMNESRLTLKHPSGFFAAGFEMKDALALLSDSAFKIYVCVCLHAGRRTAQSRFRMAELAQATGHSTRSPTSYLEELRSAEVSLVYRAANQHELGRLEIRDRFRPYEKQAAAPLEDPEQALYVARVRGLFLEPACVNAILSAADEKLAAEWYRAGVPLDQVQRAVLMGCARKYVALFNRPGGGPITSLQYFAGPLQEVNAMEMPLDYWRYLAARMRKMESQWRAQANFAPAGPATNTETK